MLILPKVQKNTQRQPSLERNWLSRYNYHLTYRSCQI